MASFVTKLLTPSPLPSPPYLRLHTPTTPHPFISCCSSPLMASCSSSPSPSPPRPETLGNAIVVGGGPAGCLMAHYLLRRGLHVHLFERRPALHGENGTGGQYTPADTRSYPILLTTRAVEALEGVGLQLPPSLLKRLIGSCVHRPNGTKVQLQYSDDPHLKSFGVSRNSLVAFLQQSLLQRHSENLSVYFGWELSAISDSKATAVFSQNRKYMTAVDNYSFEEGSELSETVEVEFDLLIGSDGVSSKVRSELLRLDKLTRPHVAAPMTLEFLKNPESYKSFYIRPSLAKASPLYEDHDRVQSWPALNMLLLNVADGSFWGGSKNAELLSTSSPMEVERIFGERAPEVLDLLVQENPSFAEDFIEQPSISFGGAVKLSRFHDDNIVLIGDAAHAMFPSYGTGCNAALEDCLLFDNILGEFILTGEGKPPFGLATSEFTKRRLEDAHAIVDMNTNLMLFSRGVLGVLQTTLLTTLHKWFPKLFGPTAYQLLWSTVPFSDIKSKKYKENLFFYGVLVLLGSLLLAAAILVMKRIMA